MSSPLDEPIDPLLILSVAADLVAEHPDYGPGVAALIAALLDNANPDPDLDTVLAVLAGIRGNG